MRFILHEIKLWFKDKSAEPKVLEFIPNKVNVITGDATVGKTSIWNIIDYCFLSDRVNIANTINELVDWYGISFSINDKIYNIARKSPQKNTVSAAVCLLENNDGIENFTPNITIPELKAKLDIVFGITDNVRFPFGKQSGETNFNLSYRYFLLFNSLTENIIGSNLTYFDTALYGKEDFDRALPIIFDLAIGVNDMENIKAEERKKEINKGIEKLKNQQKRKESEEKKYAQDILSLLSKCKEKGFIDYLDNTLSVEDAIVTIQSIIDSYKRLAQNDNLFNELDQLNKQKSVVNSQIFAIKKYQGDFKTYKKNLDKVADGLKPIELLSSKYADQLINSYEIKAFIELLEESLLEIKINSKKMSNPPLKVEGDIKILEAELKSIDDKIKYYDAIKQNYQTELQKYIFIGEIKNEFNRVNSRKQIEPLDTVKLNQLMAELRVVEQKPIDNKGAKFMLMNKLNESIQHIYNQVKSMSTYKNCKTIFNEQEMVLELQRPGELFPIGNIGSKSNYMFMKLCFYLGLHTHMISVGQIHVPQFLFIDQPSIPYYSGEDGNTKNKDKEKLQEAFSILNKFVSEINEIYKTNFQIILTEHAPKEYWESYGLDNYHTVAEFINGEGLIPSNVYKVIE